MIGSGSGGLTVALGLARLGRPVTLIEGHHVGGDCTNVGCVPSKTLIHLAKTFRPGMNVDEVVREVTRKRDALREKETEEVEHTPNLTFIRGMAEFSGPKTLTVRNGAQTQVVSGDHIVIATGSHPRWIDIPGLPRDITLTNESLFDLTAAPQHLVIAGAGVIALEMAFAFHKLGVRVTVFTRDQRPLANDLPEVSEVMQAELQRRGIRLYCGAVAKGYDTDRQTLTLEREAETLEIDAVDQVLLAVGRVRNIDQLGLEQAGISVDPKRGILVNSYGETNVKGVYAIGDVTPTSAFTHSAHAQGRRVSQRIAYPLLPLAKAEPLYPYAIFSDPEVAVVGLTSAQLAQRYHPGVIRRIRVDFQNRHGPRLHG